MKNPISSTFPKFPTLCAVQRHGRRGFTLLEILTATAISLIIITALLGITQTILQNFQKIRGNTVMEGDAVVALDMLVNDLEALVVTTAPDSQSLLVAPDPDSSNLNGATGAWLTFLTSAVDKEPAGYQGAVRAVSYRLAWQDPIMDPPSTNDEDKRFALYRAIAPARDTFDNAMGRSDLQDEYWDAGGSDTPDPIDRENYLVGDIVRFEIRFQRADDKTWTESNHPVQITANGAFVDVNNDGTFEDTEKVPGGFLTCEINVTSLDPQGSKILRVGGVTLDQAIQRFGKSYVRNTAIFWEL